jgi:hypothetical protein
VLLADFKNNDGRGKNRGLKREVTLLQTEFERLIP